MAKNSADYWRDREAAQRKKDIVDQLAYNREIRRIYQSTLDNVQKEIDAFYGKYAKKEGITLAEAKRRVSRLDMEAYERKAKRYVKERDFSPQANEEMRLYNLTMKVNRLEMLKANIGLELIRGFDDLNKTFDEKLTRHATGEFERLAGILGDSVRNNSELAHAIVNASFHNATYSDRIWAYQDLLRDEIGKQVQTGLLQGRNSMELARAVQKRFDVSRSDAERLMMTEMRRVRTEVAKQSYEQNGNTEYQFLALGGNPCNDCADLDGRVFPVKEMMPGTNAPPMHPRCLCSTAPYWDEAKFQEWLDGPAQDGVPWAEFDESWFKGNATNKAHSDITLQIRSPSSPKSLEKSLVALRNGKAGLSKARKQILARVPNSGKYHRFSKNKISVHDLAYLSAATGHEFSLFRGKKEDVLFHGTTYACNITGDIAKELIKKRYKWIAHSHVDMGNLVASSADRNVLRKLKQQQSIIIGPTGKEIVFKQSEFS